MPLVADFTLPADWERLMGILAELKKPKLPEYVRAGTKGIHYKIAECQGPKLGVAAYDVYGRPCKILLAGPDCAPITEQEFIEGGLKELAEAGFVKGAAYKQDERPMFKVGYSNNPCHGHQSRRVDEVVKEKGFCFMAYSGCEDSHTTWPVAQIELLPKLPTTSEGIPYLIDGGTLFYGSGDKEGKFQLSNLRHLMRQGVTGLDTKAGRLTKADLELLTK